MKTFLALTSLLFAGQVHASGCGSYETIFNIEELQSAGTVDSADFEVLTEDSTFVQVRLKGQASPVTLIYTGSLVGPDEATDGQLLKFDILFEDGYGCGPVYHCATGQYKIVIKDYRRKTRKVFEWPVMNRSNQQDVRTPQVAGSLLPPNFMKAPSGSKLPQCEYGNW